MATRIIVTGKYLNKSTYVLVEEDGTVFQEIKEGEPFRIGNQMRSYYPVRVPRKSGKGTLLVCRKYGDSGYVMEEFPLIHGKKGLWALTSGAARNGVFHNYREPKGALEQALADIGVSARIIERVPEIGRDFEIGGQLCRHVTRQWGYELYADGKAETLTEPPYVEEDSNQYHIGCLDGTYTVRLTGGTYALYYSVDTSMNGSVWKHLDKVLITPDADETVVAKEIAEIERR